MLKHVYLPIEIKSRDLMGRVILASYLAEKNYKVIMFFKGHTDEVLKHFPRGIYFHYGIVTNYLKIIQKVKKLGHTVVAWDEEGFVFPSDDEYINNRINTNVYNELKKYFLWGNHQKYLLKNKLNDLSNTKTVGHPRFDLFRKEFREYLLIDSNKIKEKYGKFILINTKFNSNHFLGKQQAVNRLTESDYFGDDDKLEKYHINKMEYNSKNFDLYASLIPKLSKKYLDYKIIIRPHPSENFSTWEKICIKHKLNNVHVVHKGSVLQWLLAADIMIHNGCTTGVESFILGKPSILYKPVIDKRFDIFLIDQLSKEINNEKSLLDYLNNLLQNNDVLFSENEIKIKTDLLNKYVCGIDGISASKNIYNELEKIDFDKYKISYNYIFRLKIKMLYKSVKEKIKKYLLVSNEYKYLTHKFSKVTMKELSIILDNLNDTTGLYTNTKIKKISTNIFCYYRK